MEDTGDPAVVPAGYATLAALAVAAVALFATLQVISRVKGSRFTVISEMLWAKGSRFTVITDHDHIRSQKSHWPHY